jgi:hypothetical protein
VTQGFPVIGEYVGFGSMAVEAHRGIEMGWMMETEPNSIQLPNKNVLVNAFTYPPF